jgi:hypothetical protein
MADEPIDSPGTRDGHPPEEPRVPYVLTHNDKEFLRRMRVGVAEDE